jgi:transcriptional regulator with XRE-family HTH domain
MSPLLPERTSWSRVLGAELRAARLRAGYKNADLAEKLMWSPAKVSRMETGIRNGSTLDLVSFATACGIFGAELKRLMELGTRPWDGYWIQSNGEPMPTNCAP